MDDAPSSIDCQALSDSALLEAAKAGSREAYVELWQRHRNSATAYAHSFRSIAPADDLVAEAHTRILAALRRGKGPVGAFRAYLISTIRNTALNWSRVRKREQTISEFDRLDGGSESAEATVTAALDKSITATAYASLPPRWQEVLWYSEVEQLSRSAIAILMSIDSNAVSQLTFRAREALRAAWIQAHLNSDGLQGEHRAVVEMLGRRTRGTLSRRDLRAADAHIADCAPCLMIAEEADTVGSRLSFAILPLVAGAAGAVHATQTGELAFALSAQATAPPATAMPPSGGALWTNLPAGMIHWNAGFAAAASVIVIGAVAGSLAGAGGGWGPSIESSSSVSALPGPRSDTDALPPMAPSPVASAPAVHAPAPEVPISETPNSEVPISDAPVSDAPISQPPTPPTPVLVVHPEPTPPPAETEWDAQIHTPDDGALVPVSYVDLVVDLSVGATALVLVDGANYAFAGGTSGEFQLRIEPLTDGAHVIDVLPVGADSVDSGGSRVWVTVDTTVAAPEVDSTPNASTWYLPELTGAAEPGGEVHVNLEGATHTVPVADDGVWTFRPELSAAGDYPLLLSYADPAGNVSVDVSVPITLTAPTLRLRRNREGHLRADVEADDGAFLEVFADKVSLGLIEAGGIEKFLRHLCRDTSVSTVAIRYADPEHAARRGLLVVAVREA